MDTQTAAPTRLCRNCENFIEGLCKKSNLKGNVSAEYGWHTQALLREAVWGNGNAYKKKILEPACWCENGYKHDRQSRNGAYHRDGEAKDLVLLGLFCFCLLVLNLACWTFFAGVPAGR